MNGLVLEGGAMRGLFTAGVLDAWYDSGIRFDGIIGVSAGACFGCNFKSHQPGRVIRYNKRLAKDPRYCSWTSLLKTGDLFGAEFAFHELPKRIDPFNVRRFESDPTNFYCVMTEVKTGKPYYRQLKKADDRAFEWIRASASMPVVSRPVEIDGEEYLDGGLSDGIPLKYFESLGYLRNVVVTTRPDGYRKFPTWKTRLARPFLEKYPKVYEALATRHIWYNETLDYLKEREKDWAAFVVRPEEELPIGRVCHDPEVMQRVYDIGLSMGHKSLNDLKYFLNRKVK